MLTIDKTFSGIQKVPKALSFDENSLSDWMELNIESFEGPIIVNQFSHPEKASHVHCIPNN